MITLHEWQKPSADHLTAILGSRNMALDASDTGTGKTYVALEVAQRLGWKPLILCPRAAIPTWRRVSAEAGLEPIDIINPEKLKSKYSPYVNRGGRANEFIWKSSIRTLIVDECHRFSGVQTENAWLLAAAKRFGIKCLCLSATAAESPLKMRALGFLCGLHAWRDFYDWALRNGCYRNPWNGIEFTQSVERRKEFLKVLHHQIFPDHGVRLRIKDIPEFPENEIIVEAYELNEKATKCSREAYAEAFAEIEANPKASQLTVLLRARQKAELFKIDLLADMAEDLFNEDSKSTVVFLSFRETQRLLRLELQKRLGGTPILQIHGDQSAEERENNIQDFQSGRGRVMLVMVQAGGVSLSLHDETGDRPRVALICPTFSAIELRQALGRVHRASGKSKSIQKIVFAAGTVEEQVCVAIRRKLGNLELLNDGDLQGDIKW